MKARLVRAFHMLDAVVQKQGTPRRESVFFTYRQEGLWMRLFEAQLVAVMRLLERTPKRRDIRQGRLQIRLEHCRVNGVGVAEQEQARARTQSGHEVRPCGGHARQDATPGFVDLV